jgi:hypothetical protein
MFGEVERPASARAKAHALYDALVVVVLEEGDGVDVSPLELA